MLIKDKDKIINYGTDNTTYNVLCEICGERTQYDATKRCNLCWEMEKGLRILKNKDKNKAKKWLKDQLKELGD